MAWGKGCSGQGLLSVLPWRGRCGSGDVGDSFQGGQALCPCSQVGRGPASLSGPEDSELKLGLTHRIQKTPNKQINNAAAAKKKKKKPFSGQLGRRGVPPQTVGRGLGTAEDGTSLGTVRPSLPTPGPSVLETTLDGPCPRT